ncbi:hypothetical protein PHMEG_00016434 [Phytophthora megakarya]|uniref:Uncharacterized protein n=1 Tax=Phytophthora megakarya TaxID=4795 RepID=A0A225VYV3_9STRA|nr:hypothetical protein PHMEG_00016434 [Phytophthora megakarya]
MTPSLRLGLAALVKMIRTLYLRSVREVLKALAITSDPPVVPSEQRDATRTDDSVTNLGCRLRVLSQHGETIISLFHELRYWSSKKTSGRSRLPEWQILCQSWNQFVENFNKDSTAYRDRIASSRERFMKYSITSVLQRVHEGSVNANIPCAVPVGVNCPHCPPGAPRISERDLTGYTTNRVPANVKELRTKLACTCQHRSVVPEHNTPRNTVPRSVTPPGRGGFVRLHHFRNVRHQDVSGKPRVPIVSNEYENEPDFGSSSDWYGQQSDPPRGESYRGQSYASVGSAGRSSYGQPQVGHCLQALHARVEALERIRASQITELKQNLNVQKAYVVEAAQTTSNIRVEVSEQVRLLREKVKRLEERLKSRRASSSCNFILYKSNDRLSFLDKVHCLRAEPRVQLIGLVRVCALHRPTTCVRISPRLCVALWGVSARH